MVPYRIINYDPSNHNTWLHWNSNLARSVPTQDFKPFLGSKYGIMDFFKWNMDHKFKMKLGFQDQFKKINKKILFTLKNV